MDELPRILDDEVGALLVLLEEARKAGLSSRAGPVHFFFIRAEIRRSAGRLLGRKRGEGGGPEARVRQHDVGFVLRQALEPAPRRWGRVLLRGASLIVDAAASADLLVLLLHRPQLSHDLEELQLGGLLPTSVRGQSTGNCEREALG